MLPGLEWYQAIAITTLCLREGAWLNFLIIKTMNSHPNIDPKLRARIPPELFILIFVKILNPNVLFLETPSGL